MKYKAQEELEVFINNAGGISITSKDPFENEPVTVMLNKDAAKFIIRSVRKLIKEIEDEQ